MQQFIHITILLLSLVLFYFANQYFNETQHFINDGVKTTAVVIDLERETNSDGSVFFPVFEYTGLDKEKITFRGNVGSSPASYSIGEQVSILYSLTTKERRILSYWGLYRWTLVLLIFATPLFVVGLGFILYNR